MYYLDISNFSYFNLFMVILFSLIVGVLFSTAYYIIHRNESFDRSFMITLLLLPLVISSIIMLVGSDYAKAFSIAGIFALVKFRMNVSGAKNMLFIISETAVGLAIGIGYIFYGLIIAAIVSLILVIISFTKLENGKRGNMKLKVMIPEDLNYENLFNDIFDSYLIKYNLIKVKTTEFGTMFELTYDIHVKNDFKQKEFIDKLRVLNGNLNITLIEDYHKSINDITE